MKDTVRETAMSISGSLPRLGDHVIQAYACKLMMIARQISVRL